MKRLSRLVVVPVGYYIFEMVGKHFPAHVDAGHAFRYFLALHERDKVCETVATVYHQTTAFWRIFFAVLIGTECPSYNFSKN